MIIKYDNKEYLIQDFLNLSSIGYNKKVEFITKTFTHKQNVEWSILCAESVLRLYEDEYKNDKRPRLALEAAKRWAASPTQENKDAANAAANAAAYAAANATNAAYAAANAAAYAAVNAAHAANAAYAAANATNAVYAVYAAYAAANAAADAANAAEKKQETLNLELMLIVIYPNKSKGKMRGDSI